MTNYLAKPGGWTDHDVTDGVISAEHLNIIDRGAAGGLKGSGGTVSPAQELRIEDLGTDNLLSSYLRGTMDRGASGRYRPRINGTFIDDVVPVQYLDTTYDIWWSDTASTGVWQLWLVTSAGDGQVPIVGDEIAVSITTRGNQVDIYQAGPVVVVSFPAARTAQAANSPNYASFRYSGASWQVSDASSDVVIV